MIRETAAWTLVLAVLLTGCGPGDRLPDDPGTPAEAVGSLVCPEVPVPSLEGVEDAVKELVQEQLAAVEEDCSGPELGRLGMLYHAYDFFGGAEECYRLAEERDAQELRWPYFQGHLLANRGATDEAEAKFGRALDLDPSCRVAKLHLAEVLLRSNELDRAEALFQETLVDGEDDAFTLFGLARIAAARGRPEAAIPRFQKALELDPEADAIHYALALAYRDAGETELAQKHLSRRGKVKPAPLDSYLAELRQFRIGARTHIIQAQFAHQAGHWEEAERLYREALKEDPEEVDTWVNLGIVLLKQGRIDEAVELLESAVAADPDAIAARYHLAENHLRHGHPERAVEHLEKALAREPGRVSLELALAAAYRSSGRFDDALERYRRAVEVDPGNPEGRLGRALCLARLHRFAEARQSLRGGSPGPTRSARLSPCPGAGSGCSAGLFDPRWSSGAGPSREAPRRGPQRRLHGNSGHGPGRRGAFRSSPGVAGEAPGDRPSGQCSVSGAGSPRAESGPLPGRTTVSRAVGRR